MAMSGRDRLSPGGLAAALGEAREVYVPGCSAEITDLPAMLGECRPGTTVTGIFSPILNTLSYADAASGRRCRTFFLIKALRQGLADGQVDLCPWTYGQIARWLARPGRFGAAIVTVSPPDADGMCSFGTQADFLPDFYASVPHLVGIINPDMPRTFGEPGIPLDRFTALFEHGQELLAIPVSSAAPDPATAAIATTLAGLIPDGATLQMGIGRVPQAVSAALTGHRDLRIHSGLVDDSILLLEDAGSLDRDVPIVSGVAMGSRALYDRIDGNERFAFRPASHTHDLAVVAGLPRFFTINAALQIDLFGQVNSEGGNGRVLATPGGLPAFVQGAQAGQGTVIFALRAGRGRRTEGGIVARICDPGLVTIPGHGADMVVTEYGVADLRGRSIDEKAELLVAVADPAERATLADRWQAIRRVAFA